MKVSECPTFLTVFERFMTGYCLKKVSTGRKRSQTTMKLSKTLKERSWNGQER
jgi:hypothetical protein